MKQDAAHAVPTGPAYMAWTTAQNEYVHASKRTIEPLRAGDRTGAGDVDRLAEANVRLSRGVVALCVSGAR